MKNIKFFIFTTLLIWFNVSFAQTTRSIYYDLLGNKTTKEAASQSLNFTLNKENQIVGWSQLILLPTIYTKEDLIYDLVLTDTIGTTIKELKASQLVYYKDGKINTKCISSVSGGQPIKDLSPDNLTGFFYTYNNEKITLYGTLNEGKPIFLYNYDKSGKLSQVIDFSHEKEGYDQIFYIKNNEFWTKRFEATFDINSKNLPLTTEPNYEQQKDGGFLTVTETKSCSNMFESPLPLNNYSNVSLELEIKSGTSYCGMIFGATSGSGNGWKFCINKNGLYEIMKLMNGEVLPISLRKDRFDAIKNRMKPEDIIYFSNSPIGYSTFINKTGSNIISIRRVDSYIIFFINGNQIERISSDVFGDYVGIVADRSERGNTECLYSNLSITNIVENFNPNEIEDNISNSSSIATGTGFLINNTGIILTNYHVVQGSSKISILIDKQYKACKLMGFDKEKDLAILKPLTSLPIKNSNPVVFSGSNKKLGEKIFVLGYPSTAELGNSIKVTDGLLSSMNVDGLFQISSPIQHGNSGSPLFDYFGRVIGVVNAGIPSLENVGFAIKLNEVTTFLKKYNVLFLQKQQMSSGVLTDLVDKNKNSIFLIKSEFE